MMRFIWAWIMPSPQPAGRTGAAPPPPSSDYLLDNNGTDVLTDGTDRLVNA